MHDVCHSALSITCVIKIVEPCFYHSVPHQRWRCKIVLYMHENECMNEWICWYTFSAQRMPGSMFACTRWQNCLNCVCECASVCVDPHQSIDCSFGRLSGKSFMNNLKYMHRTFGAVFELKIQSFSVCLACIMWSNIYTTLHFTIS